MKRKEEPVPRSAPDSGVLVDPLTKVNIKGYSDLAFKRLEEVSLENPPLFFPIFHSFKL